MNCYEIRYYDRSGNGWRRVEYGKTASDAIGFALKDNDVQRVISCKPYGQEDV